MLCRPFHFALNPSQQGRNGFQQLAKLGQRLPAGDANQVEWRQSVLRQAESLAKQPLPLIALYGTAKAARDG